LIYGYPLHAGLYVTLLKYKRGIYLCSISPSLIFINMQLKEISPRMLVENVNQTVQWYESVLGFSLVSAMPETGTYDWAMVKQGDVTLTFQQRKSFAAALPVIDRPAGASLVMVMAAALVRDIHSRLKDKVKVHSGPEETARGTLEFTFEDCNGYLFTLSEDILICP
jgi:lactoylglutathione lyase